MPLKERQTHFPNYFWMGYHLGSCDVSNIAERIETLGAERIGFC